MSLLCDVTFSPERMIDSKRIIFNVDAILIAFCHKHTVYGYDTLLLLYGMLMLHKQISLLTG